jgi:hypothetical protein
MAMDDRRSLPSVFSDIRTNSDVERAERRASGARRMASTLMGAVFILVLIAGGLAYFWYQQKSDADDLGRQVADLHQQQQEYDTITSSRADVFKLRRDLDHAIQGEPRYAGQLLDYAQNAWKNQHRTDVLTFSGDPPGRWASQTWSTSRQQAMDALAQERLALNAVSTSVHDEIVRLRHTNGGGPCAANPLNCPQQN